MLSPTGVKFLSNPGRNCCTTRKELVAVIRAVEYLLNYHYGWKFHLRTYHDCLTWLLDFKIVEGQICRWIQRLQEYDFEIWHLKWTLHGNRKVLSGKHCNFLPIFFFKDKDEIGFDDFSRTPCYFSTPSKPDPLNNECVKQALNVDPDIKPIVNLMDLRPK